MFSLALNVTINIGRQVRSRLTLLSMVTVGSIYVQYENASGKQTTLVCLQVLYQFSTRFNTLPPKVNYDGANILLNIEHTEVSSLNVV